MVNLCPHVPKAVKIYCGLSREISPRFPQVKGVEPHHALSVLKASPDDAGEIPKRFQEVDTRPGKRLHNYGKSPCY